MANRDYGSVPHYDLIVPNGTIEIGSMFQIKRADVMSEFLAECARQNCAVRFVNEDLVIWPGDNTLIANMYATVAGNPKVVEDYFRYLMKLERGEIKEI